MIQFGLSEQTIKSINDVFTRFPSIDSAILYGSRAKGNFRINSDIDLTLKGSAIDFTMLLKIENELDDLMLPYKIDLSVFKNIENQDLIEHINRVGIEFYNKSYLEGANEIFRK